eukprot:Hpha_TRINITY_DN2442_c0_g1::TRINITY_DN2442_c0_g1_i1::g.24548::m.24548
MLRFGRALLSAARPVVGGLKPIRMDPSEVEADKEYWWCACGLSKNQPWCDGSHTGTGIYPVQVEFPQGVPRHSLCTCKASGKAPFCDGKHKQLTEANLGQPVPES